MKNEILQLLNSCVFEDVILGIELLKKFKDKSEILAMAHVPRPIKYPFLAKTFPLSYYCISFSYEGFVYFIWGDGDFFVYTVGFEYVPDEYEYYIGEI